MTKIRITNKDNQVIGDYELPVHFIEVPVVQPPTHPAPTFMGTQNSDTSTTLNWNAPQASGIYLQGVGVTGPTNMEIVKPAVDTTYTLRVTYPGESDVNLTVLAKAYVPPVVPPVQPPATDLPMVGMNVLFEGIATRQAFNEGCKFFLVMSNTDMANWLAQQGATVMYRQWLDHVPSVSELVNNWLSATRLDPRIIRTGINENEGINGNDIQWHAAFDRDVALGLKNQNASIRYAGGTYSMGTPDITNPAIRDLMRKYYAPIYNSGLIWWDQHLYSPTQTHIYNDADLPYFERRWQWYFDSCGFDPNIRHIVSGEMGLDVGGGGGFPQFNTSDADVIRYCNRWVEIQARPVMVNGVSYPSPVVGGAIFQLGDNPKWAGYDMRRYLPALDTFWK